MAEKKVHYDGDAPQKPLDPEHFTAEERADARDLGDGSPGIEPRRTTGKKGDTGAASEEKTDDVREGRN